MYSIESLRMSIKVCLLWQDTGCCQWLVG